MATKTPNLDTGHTHVRLGEKLRRARKHGNQDQGRYLPLTLDIATTPNRKIWGCANGDEEEFD